MKRLKFHLFVCTNERPAGHPRGCCMEKWRQKQGTEELVQLFKKELASSGLGGDVRAQKAGCLDVCEFGPAVVIYPDNIWYGQVSAQDVPEIIAGLREGKPVQRLLIPGK